MKINEKYLEALKTFTDYMTISEWAIKFSEMYPDELKKANIQAQNQVSNTTGLREIAHRIRKNLKQNKSWSGLIAASDSLAIPIKVKYVVNNGIKDMNKFMNNLYEPSDENNDKKTLPFETIIDELEYLDLKYLYGKNHNLPSREDSKYTENIEKIDEYEFTSSIMLEMANRNSDVIKIITQIENIHKIMLKTLTKIKKQDIDESSIKLEVLNYFDKNKSLIPHTLIIEYFMYLFDMSLDKMIKELDFDFFETNNAIEKFYNDNEIVDKEIKYLHTLSSIVEYLQLRLNYEFLIYPNKYYKDIDDIAIQKVRSRSFETGNIPNVKYAYKILNKAVIRVALNNFRKLKPNDLKTVADYFFAYDYDKKKKEKENTKKYISREIKLGLTLHHGINIKGKGTFTFAECLERYDDFKNCDAEFHYTEKTIRDQISFMQKFIDSNKHHKANKNIPQNHLTDKHYRYLIYN